MVLGRDSMTLSELVKQVAEEMAKEGWEELPVEFNTSDRRGLSWLSIYENGGVVHMDIGKEGE